MSPLSFSPYHVIFKCVYSSNPFSLPCFLFRYILKIWGIFLLCKCVSMAHQFVHLRQQVSTELRCRSWITAHRLLTDVGAGNQTWVPCRSGEWLQARSLLSCCFPCIFRKPVTLMCFLICVSAYVSLARACIVCSVDIQMLRLPEKISIEIS